MFDDHFETPDAGTVAGLADSNDDFPPPFADDGLPAEIGLRAIRKLRGLPSRGRRGRMTGGKGKVREGEREGDRERPGSFAKPTSTTGTTRRSSCPSD